MPTPPQLEDPEVWARLVAAANPASILVAIAYRMGSDLRQRATAEDVWQESLLRAWQARSTFTWRDTPSFRRWLIRIAEHVIADLRDHEKAQKRDSGRTVRWSSPTASASNPSGAGIEPIASTTPSRILVERDRALAMEQALAALPEELREVVRLRLFEDLQIAEIAGLLELGESAVRHRFRKGAELYQLRLRGLLDGS